MLKSPGTPCIRLRGVRHNNLKNFDLDLPLKKLIVITGLSGSGKSSLAFDTLFAEGQRRYIETFSPYARQFLDRMDKPRVDSISGIPPAIAIEQRNSVKTTRSTVGTMTEICDFMKALWPRIATLYCRSCGKPVAKEPPLSIWAAVCKEHPGAEMIIAFSVPLSKKLSVQDSLALIARQGYQRLLSGNRVVRLDEFASAPPSGALAELVVVQDRLKIAPENRARFTEACEQAYHFGKGSLALYPVGARAQEAGQPMRFSNRLHCAACDVEYREPSTALFSFNHPLGACPACKGFGRVISIDYNLAIPDRSRTLRQGVVKPWLTGLGAECQADLLRMCRQLEIPLDVPFKNLPAKWQQLVIDGEPDYGKDEEHEWPRAWYGVKGYFRWLESKAYKMHVRVLLSRYRAYTPCPECLGSRFQPEAMLYKLDLPEDLDGIDAPRRLALSEFYRLPIRDSLRVIESLRAKREPDRRDPLGLVLPEVHSRLQFIQEVGLGYLTLDRSTRSLSGGEVERVNLTSCLGTRLVNTLFVLDEPSVGLHPRDTDRLVRVLEQLRDAGNTVVVVEHEPGVMRAADQIVDLGPGHGASGGEVVFQGTYREILQSGASLTGKYLAAERKLQSDNARKIPYPAGMQSASALRDLPVWPALATSVVAEVPAPAGELPPRGRRALATGSRLRQTDVSPARTLKLSNATRHNLRDLSVEIPLGKLVCVTGLSGSGKTTLVRELLLPALQEKLRCGSEEVKASERSDEPEGSGESGEEGAPEQAGAAVLEGWESLNRVVLVDQAILGKTPRSNPAVYIGAFDDIRDFFAASEPARSRGLNASAFSFNSGQGQCERCRGAGFEKIEMQFLSDVYIQCPECNGKRYREHILQIKVPVPRTAADHATALIAREYSVADLLDATIDEAVDFFSRFEGSPPARRAEKSLRWLVAAGLGYLKLGQPINTLSGGECQRLKLVRHLADIEEPGRHPDSAQAGPASQSTLFLFDEPTTGLHFEDVRVLLRIFRGLVQAGHSIIVIEHNLDVMRASDWIIDLGPGAGDEGGRLVAAGAPQDIARVPGSETGKALRGENI